jgi:hypothetical protein
VVGLDVLLYWASLYWASLYWASLYWASLYWASLFYVGLDKAGDFSRAELYGIAPTLPLFMGATLLGLTVAIGAALHALTRVALGRALLWLATLLLAAATALAFAGVDTVRYLSLAGPYLTPARALASAGRAGFRWARQRLDRGSLRV